MMKGTVMWMVACFCASAGVAGSLHGQEPTTPAWVTEEPVNYQMVAKIREEGFQRSQIVEKLSYMTDVLGARLTNSKDM
ncbi:uncharacterized protein METZ01_LOCUS433409, partial [marine metagenome]